MHWVQMFAWVRITEVLQPDNFTHYFFYIIFILHLIIRLLIHSLNRIQLGISQMHSLKPFLAP